MWGPILFLALLAALSPATLLPILVLLSLRGPRVVLAYFVGTVCSTSVVMTATIAGLAGAEHGSDGVSAAKVAFELALGCVLCAFGLRNWRRRHDVSAKDEPKWMQRIRRFGPITAFLFGLIWITTALAIDAGIEVAKAGVSAQEAALAVVVYTLVSCSSPLVLVCFYFADEARAQERLGAWQSWLVRNGTAIASVALLVLGLVLLGKGLTGLPA